MEVNVDWVLLVDDDEVHNFIHTRVLLKYLKEQDIQVAYNGEQALLILQNKIQNGINMTSGIIFLDINMPVMNGFQFVEEFKKQYGDLLPNIRLLPLSSSEHMDDIVKMNDLGIEQYLVKPLTYEVAGELLNAELL